MHKAVVWPGVMMCDIFILFFIFSLDFRLLGAIIHLLNGKSRLILAKIVALCILVNLICGHWADAV